MQKAPASHRYTVQGWKEARIGKGGKAPRTRETRIWRTTLRAPKEILKDLEKTNAEAEVQDLWLYQTEKGDAPHKTHNWIGRDQHERMGKTVA